MLLSNNVNRTVQQLPKDTYINLKKPMFYVVTSSLLLMAGMQSANAATCAPDVEYLLLGYPQFNKNYAHQFSVPLYKLVDGSKSADEVIQEIQESINSHNKDRDWMQRNNSTEGFLDWDFSKNVFEEQSKQAICYKNGGKFAASSEGFDANGNYKGSTQQASNKKNKSGKSNNQEQVASANSKENNTNSTDSNNAESSDAKSKGKEFAKDEKRLHANACVAVQRDKNKVPAFKNICPYPIEVVWCANSKEDPNQCDRGWNGQWNFGVAHSEPIHATSETTHWIVAACKGENSLFMNEELKRNKKVRCVKWDN